MGYEIKRKSDHVIWDKEGHSVAIPHTKDVNRMLTRRLLKEIGYKEDVPEINYHPNK